MEALAGPSHRHGLEGNALNPMYELRTDPIASFFAAAGFADSPDALDGFCLLVSLPFFAILFFASLATACFLIARLKRTFKSDRPIHFWSFVDLLIFLVVFSSITIALAILGVNLGFRLFSAS